MKKNTKLIILLIVSLLLFFVIGCAKEVEGSDNEPLKGQSKEENFEEKNEDVVVLKIWSWYSYDWTIKHFEEENEGIIVEQKLFGFEECEEAYMEAIAKGEGPDVLILDSSFFGTFTASGILQDLSLEPFSAGKYKNNFLGWESGFSVNNELLALTINTSPYVTLYRADVMEEYGFPSEPEEFGEFIKVPENILEIARKLKEDDKYIFQFPTDLPDLVGGTLGFFNERFEYRRHGDLFELALNMAKETYQNELEAKVNFWGESGQEAVIEDKLVMVTAGSYAMSNIKNYAPQQSGLWRVTTPPLGLASWASDSKIAINSQSQHKEEAWKLVEHIATHKSGGEFVDVVPGYIPVHGNETNTTREEEFFGNQIIYPLLEELAANMTQFRLTTFDAMALQMYRDGVWQAAGSSLPAEAHVEKMKKEIEDAVKSAH
jgi:multiple sugar transport system substrate-binding protein